MPKNQATNEELSQKDQREREMLFRRVFGSEDGLKVLRHLTAEFKYNESSFSGDFNPHRASHRDGQKTVITYILVNSTKPTDEHEH